MNMRRMRVLLFFAFSAFPLAACNKQTEIAPEPNGSAASGGTGAVDAASEASPAKTECPKALPGAALVRLPGENGTYYCMDDREVLNSEYKAFLTAMAGKLPEQPSECKWNDRLDPELWEEGSGGVPKGCFADDWKLDSEPNRAVNCVDFCDSFAYCKWAGKRLCGEQGKPGDVVNVFANDDGLQAVSGSVQNEWFSACTQGGKTAYPYGNGYEPGRCVDLAKVTSQGKSVLDVQNTQQDTCAGSTAPYDSVHHLSGNLYEWTNFCRDDGWSCKIQGGSYDSAPSELACANLYVMASVTNNAFVGFRCCADAVEP